jgi:hypothetical protein
VNDREHAKKSEEPAMHFMQFGSGHVYAKPVAGNPVVPQPWTWKRVRSTLFGSLMQEVEIKLDNNAVQTVRVIGKMYRVEMGSDGLPEGERTVRDVWEKPDWMKRVAARFKPRHSGGRG